MTERYGAYMLNFFASQPALNYGWLYRTEKWMSAVDSPEAIATREAMKDIMRFWLDRGCALPSPKPGCQGRLFRVTIALRSIG